jgi:hypothetical protein
MYTWEEELATLACALIKLIGWHSPRAGRCLNRILEVFGSRATCLAAQILLERRWTLADRQYRQDALLYESFVEEYGAGLRLLERASRAFLADARPYASGGSPRTVSTVATLTATTRSTSATM